MSLKLSVCPVGVLLRGRNPRFTLFNDCPFRMIYETKILKCQTDFFQEISKIINKAGKVANIFTTFKYLEMRKIQKLSFLTKNQF